MHCAGLHGRDAAFVIAKKILATDTSRGYAA
jgi:hypothetical protein